MARKQRVQFICEQCGCVTPKWVGRCPGCSAWNSMIEKMTPAPGGAPLSSAATAAPITEVISQDETSIARWETGLPELDRVLGGGLVPGSLILVGGDPGIGKSTLWLQVAVLLAERGHKILYVSGEESSTQIAWRAKRLGSLQERLLVMAETNMEQIQAVAEREQPQVVVIDSIQTMMVAEIGGLPGSVVQVRACTGNLLRLAKSQTISTIVVGHVTKTGELAGPRLLEHMVDTVLYLEGDRHRNDRLLRSVKNRFGSTQELGIFALRSEGFVGIPNPSERMLADRPVQASGTAVIALMEGSRSLLVELQALVTPTKLAIPRRIVTGLDLQRLHLLLAVLEKRLRISLQQHDAFLNVVGGLSATEPAADLGVAVSIVSSVRDVATRLYDGFVGEVGLAGELRGVGKIEARLAELANLGFQRALIPVANQRDLSTPPGIEVVGVATLEEAIKIALEG